MAINLPFKGIATSFLRIWIHGNSRLAFVNAPSFPGFRPCSDRSRVFQKVGDWFRISWTTSKVGVKLKCLTNGGSMSRHRRNLKLYLSFFLRAVYKVIEERSKLTLSRFVFQDSKVTVEKYRSLGFPGAEEIANMFAFYIRGNPDRDTKMSRKLNSEIQSFKIWVKENKEMLRKAFGSLEVQSG